ncbi:MAG: hypothetical protein OXQ28_04150 [Acidobacteriota bacterium]|nr:hypothetical protein [Acidobacteriota bacterium]
MKPRLLCVLVMLAAVALVLPAAAQGQTPRTAWGDPDLQGTWTNTTTTPLQRPDDLGDKEVLTDEEWAARNAVSGLSDDRPFDTVGFYNDYWLEQGQLHERTSLIVDPPNGKLPAWTPEEEQRIAARRQYREDNPPGNPAVWTDLNVYDRCLTRAMPGAMMPGFYNHNYHILQTPDHVAIVVEMIHDTRIIPLDGRGPLDPSIQQWLGNSRGRWEGDTLVVETTNLSDHEDWGATVYATGSDLRLVERFTRVDDNTIDYQFTVHDDSTFTRPWTASLPMTALGGNLYEYACHEGNYAIANMLRGARAKEAAEAAP